MILTNGLMDLFSWFVEFGDPPRGLYLVLIKTQQKSKDDDGGNDKPGDENLDKPPESSVDAPESSNAPAPVPNGDIPPPSAGPPSTVPPSEGHSDNESTSEVPEHKKILAAATWVRQALNIKEENSLWYERIGQACYLAGEYKAAIEWFDKAKSLPDCHWTVNEGQALAYAELAELEDGSHKESACREMEVVLTVLRSLKKDGRLADDDREALVRNLKKLASWQEELSATSRAFALYEEVLEVDPHEYRTCCDLLRALYEQNREEEARNMLIRIKNQPGKLKSLNQFSELLQHLASNEDDNDDLNIIVTLAQTDTTFCQHTLEAFQSAIDDARRTNQTINQGVLLLYQGIVLARGATDDTRLQQAAYSWEDCQSLYLASRYDLMETRRLAARYVTQYHFYQAIKHGDSSQESEQHFNKLLKISRIANTWTHGFRPASYIASYYVHRDQPEEARKLFMEEMVDALDILSNRDPDDDFYGYKLLANILMYTGDDLNALSAWSLLGPSDTYLSSNPGSLSNDDKAVVNSVEETPTLPPPSEPDAEESTRDRDGPLTYVCDGRCDSTWSYANDMYICRYCPDTQFTSDCLEKLKSNKLQRFICDPNHSWLHVPVWSDKEALEVGKGNVRVYGELVDGKRVGGKIVDVHEWLDEIREKWGIPKKLGGLESEAVATVA
jgi:tetratricopeptide (TPR) repeat protein